MSTMAALMVRMRGYEKTPPGDVRWGSGCRGGVQSAATSAMAVRVEDSSTMGLVGGERRDESLERKVVDRARKAPAGLMNEA
jgi:hypothetical protein